MKTLAAVLEKTGQKLQLWNLEVPPLKKGQVLVKIAYTGLCQTQVNEILGKKGEDKFLPHTLGHEASGIVEEVGESVQKVKAGDRVVLSWLKGSGLDIPSTSYRYQQQVINSGAISTFMTHAVVSENRVIPIPDFIPLREAALLGCALPTGMGIVFNQLKVRPGNTLTIFGLGGIGMSAVLAAKLIHADQIIAVDLHDDKLQVAKELGATHTINASEKDPVQMVHEITHSNGTDYSIEATGSKVAMEHAYKVVHRQKGICIIAGNIEHDATIAINPFDLICGKKIYGSWGGSAQIEKDIRVFGSLISDKKLDLSPLVTHECGLEQINEACELLKNGKVIRALIKVTD